MSKKSMDGSPEVVLGHETPTIKTIAQQSPRTKFSEMVTRREVMNLEQNSTPKETTFYSVIKNTEQLPRLARVKLHSQPKLSCIKELPRQASSKQFPMPRKLTTDPSL